MEEERTTGSFNICVPCAAPPRVRDFLMPGIIHYMKSLFTRYQLVAELFQTECEAAAEQIESDWLSSLRLTARESAGAYSEEVEPFVLLLDTLYTSPEVIEKKFPLDSCIHKDSSEPAASIMMELLKVSAAFSGGHINSAPRAAELPRNYCCRMLGPISCAVYLMFRVGGAERVEIGVSEEEGSPSLTISSKVELHRITAEVLREHGCTSPGSGTGTVAGTGTGTGSGTSSSSVPCSVLWRYRYIDGIGTIRLSP